jgi:glutathione S-transferase
VPIDIFAGETLTPAYARINPARETPVLELDDGTLVTQSNAILWYVATGTAYLPERTADRAQALQWLFFEQERVMSGIGGSRFRILTQRAGDHLASRLALGKTALELLEAHLESHDYLASPACSVADIANFAYAHVAADAGYALSDYPAVTAWLRRVEDQPGFIDDLTPYPENALPGRGSSIYDR